MADWLVTFDDIAEELKKIGFKQTSTDYYFTDTILYCRISQYVERKEIWSCKSNGKDYYELFFPQHFRVEFAERKTFNKWGDSTNFVVEIDPNNPKVDLGAAKILAEKICKSGLFDFNYYSHTIKLG